MTIILTFSKSNLFFLCQLRYNHSHLRFGKLDVGKYPIVAEKWVEWWEIDEKVAYTIVTTVWGLIKTLPVNEFLLTVSLLSESATKIPYFG